MFPWSQHQLSHPTNIALQDMHGNVFTWQQINQKINALAQYLQQQGLGKNQGLALCGKNSLEILLLYLAGIQIGSRIMGLNPAFSMEKCLQICQQNNIDYIYIEKHQDLEQELKNRATLHIISFPAEELGKNKESEDLFISSDKIFQMQEILSQPCTMTLTSGSTGMPKAVVHSIQGHLANAKGVCQLMDFKIQNSWLLSLPLYHVSGQGIVWRWLLTGATLHLPQSDFYQSLTQVSHASLVPTQGQRFLKFLAENPTQTYHTKHILLGGAMIPMALTKALKERGIICYTSYGMTEMGSTVFAKESDHLNGVGQPLLGREYQLINDDIYLRGAGLALGYWQDGKVKSFCNAEGWFATKDKGCWQNNELVILGRQDNMFISGGENIQPEEIEKIIAQNANVEQVFILPIADAEFGERPVAMVKFSEGDFTQAVKSLKIWLALKLERFKQPVNYFPLEIEKTQQGNIKISRQQLKKILAKMH